MNKTRTKPSRLATELIELAGGLKRAGLIDDDMHERISVRHHAAVRPAAIAPVTHDEVKAMREKAQMSQEVFASHLNLTADYISRLERGERRPAGAALALLDVIRRKGMESIL